MAVDRAGGVGEALALLLRWASDESQIPWTFDDHLLDLRRCPWCSLFHYLSFVIVYSSTALPIDERCIETVRFYSYTSRASSIVVLHRILIYLPKLIHVLRNIIPFAMQFSSSSFSPLVSCVCFVFLPPYNREYFVRRNQCVRRERPPPREKIPPPSHSTFFLSRRVRRRQSTLQWKYLAKGYRDKYFDRQCTLR